MPSKATLVRRTAAAVASELSGTFRVKAVSADSGAASNPVAKRTVCGLTVPEMVVEHREY